LVVSFLGLATSLNHIRPGWKRGGAGAVFNTA